MKKIWMSCFLVVTLFITAIAQYADERTGYDGDFFSLEGAIEVFKNARSIRNFERRINSRDNWVNNLDLNFDGKTDYVRVIHRRQGIYHAIILQVPLGRRDVQDIAVIEIEKTGRREAILQIVGDRDIYGEEVIVEPIETFRNTSNYHRSRNAAFVNVYYWPAVQSMFDRDYRIYASPYRWNYYPTWWSPWRPYSWTIYRPRIITYYSSCRIVRNYRSPRVHRFYWNHRSHSRVVVHRTKRIRHQRGTAHVFKHRKATFDRVRSNGVKRNNNLTTRDRTVRSNRTSTRPNVVERNARVEKRNDRSIDNRSRTKPNDSYGSSRRSLPNTSKSRSNYRKPTQPQVQTPRRNGEVRRPAERTIDRSNSSYNRSDRDRRVRRAPAPSHRPTRSTIKPKSEVMNRKALPRARQAPNHQYRTPTPSRRPTKSLQNSRSRSKSQISSKRPPSQVRRSTSNMEKSKKVSVEKSARTLKRG
ncbi:MAG: hypothetical protein HKN87_00175 [Saprospiraceae bacterium]|nr:hypothetical protein [Saprospiraceae bacterium]